MLGKFSKTEDSTVAIQLVTADDRLENHLRDLFDRDERFHISATFRDIGAAENNGGSSAQPSLLLVELDPGRPDELDALERTIRNSGTTRPVIAIIDELNPDVVRKLLQLHVADLISKSSSQLDVLKACEQAIRPESTRPGGNGAKIYAYISAGGGAGNTSLAVQSAFVIARRTRQFQSTCIIDMDFQGGAVTDYVDVQPQFQLDELTPAPERLDEHLLEVMLSRHETGLAVLATEHSLRPYNSIPTELVTRMLDLVAMKFEHVVLDMPRVWLPWTECVLRGSDRVFVVTEMTVPGLRQARRLTSAITRQCENDVDISVIVNRFRKTFFGGVNAVRQRDTQDVLGDRIAGYVSEDYPLVREAIDRGVPLFEVKKGNRIEKDLEELLFDLRPAPQPAPTPEEPALAVPALPKI